MSVEDYLNSIRKNTAATSSHSEKLSDTMKELLNYETLKKTISASVEKGNKENFKRLSELSKKILSTSEATSQELREINLLLKMFYAQIPKNQQGNTQVSAESWIKALKEVLDEFGDSLPDKFRNRLKYDIVGTAAQAGADPKQVFQQLNVTQVNQTLVLQNIYAEMKEQQMLIERKAEAEKPVKQQKERNTENFWQTRMGGVLDKLTKIADRALSMGKWLGLIYVGLGIFSQLSKDAQSVVRSLGILPLLMNSLKSLTALKNLGFLKSIGNLKGMSGLKNVGSAIKTAGTNFLWNTKAGNAILDVVTNPKLASMMTKISPLLKGAGQTLGKILWPLQIIVSAFDFIKGFTETKGTLAQKITGGLWGIVKGFVDSIWSLIKWIPKALWSVFKAMPGAIVGVIVKLQNLLFSAIKNVFTYFKTKGIKGFWEDIKGGIKSAAKFLAQGFGEMLAGIIDSMMESEWLKLIPPVVDFLKELRSKLPSGVSSAGSIDSSGQYKPAGSIYEPATGTVYMGKDALAAATPLASHISGTTPTSAKGINTAAGVKLSSQSADFIKRSGLTDTITSGIRNPGSRDWKNGKISQRSHASGNKFDIAGRDASGKMKNSKQLAEMLAKLIKTPGLIEAHVEGPQSWYSSYLGALDILKKQGLSTSKIGWWGSQYSNQPHVDVLIDPRYSGAPQNTELASTVKTVGNSLDQQKKDTVAGQLETQLAKAFNEQVKMLEKGVKAPDQLASAQNKASTAAIVGSMSPQSSGNALTFSKKNDIQDIGLHPFVFANLA